MTTLGADELARRARELEWLLSDVDGVMTGGGLYYDRRGIHMLRFDVKDGLGLKLAQRAGLKVGVFSGRASAALDRRVSELGLDVSMTGVPDKNVRFDEFLEEHSTTGRRVAFIGDDLADLAILGRCGLAFAPADAVPEIRALAHFVLEARGGRGAVREMVEIILRARGEWGTVLAPFGFDRR